MVNLPLTEMFSLNLYGNLEVALTFDFDIVILN